MRTREEIEKDIMLPDVNREILLDIRLILANIMLAQQGPSKLWMEKHAEDAEMKTLVKFVEECDKIAREG